MQSQSTNAGRQWSDNSRNHGTNSPGMGGHTRGRGAPNANPRILIRAIRYVGRYRWIAMLAYGSLIVATGAQLMVPQLLQSIIDVVVKAFVAAQILALPANIQTLAAQKAGETIAQLQAEQSGATGALITIGVGILGFAILRALFSFSQQFNAERLSQNLAFDFRNELFAKIQRLSFSYHDRNQTGQLMIRATDDVEKVRLFIGQGLIMTLQAFILLIGTLIVLWFTNHQLTLVILPILPIALVVFMVFGAVAQPLFMRVQQRLSAVNTILQENLAGFKVVKAFAREPQEQKRFDVSANALLEQQMQVAMTFSFLMPFIFLIANIGQALILYFGGTGIIQGTLTIGEWQKFSMYMMYVFFPMGQLGFIINLMSQAAASAQRIFEILDTKNEVENRPGAQEIRGIKGNVQFDTVTFRYFKGGDPVLNRVSFEAKPGQTIALLGATGSGKTTIINLLPRFYDVSEGRVLIDGHDVRDVTLESLRAQIGIVLQETTLFTGTIRDNIAFGKPDASMEQVIAVAQAAAAHDFIMEFPQEYDTPVGERGSTLSGGQKQRIAIARALLLDPRILILDDSTSSVDLATEYHIQKALDKLMKGRTSFVIAQRISTVLNADQIIVLDKGEIVARGTHEELLESSEIYAEIYTSQLIGDTELEMPEMSKESVGVAK
ncbi:Putative multidrug export ATP-binding/permease protein [Anaerolineae bacterium]|nr:Putative multidrug export ATP-binding/permease protein [Anaerolineae bacterium]